MCVVLAKWPVNRWGGKYPAHHKRQEDTWKMPETAYVILFREFLQKSTLRVAIFRFLSYNIQNIGIIRLTLIFVKFNLIRTLFRVSYQVISLAPVESGIQTRWIKMRRKVHLTGNLQPVSSMDTLHSFKKTHWASEISLQIFCCNPISTSYKWWALSGI